jgi:RND family efflux transporter MFP subunit
VKVLRGTGELVDGTPATPIVEVANTEVLELSCDVASSDLVRVDEGAAVEVRLDALPERTVDGKVARIAPTVDPTTSLGRVRIELSPPAALLTRLRIGMGGKATVAVGERPALVVPPSALRRSQDGQDQVVVCARREGGTIASAKDVTVGARSAAGVEITRGLSVGTPVVVDRVLGLEDGTPVAPQKPSKRGEPAP